jgi:hypothetical protein
MTAMYSRARSSERGGMAGVNKVTDPRNEEDQSEHHHVVRQR